MLASLPSSVSIIIVDNGSVDNIDQLAQQHQATLIKNAQNQGFGCACNQGAALAKTKYLMFLNPDTQVRGNALSLLLSALKNYKEAVAVCAKVIDVNGKQKYRRHSLLLPTSTNRLFYKKPTSDQSVPLLSCEAFLVSKSIYEQVGGFDENIFLYHEDDDISLRLNKLGDLMYIQNAEIMHMQGHSSARSPQNAALKAYYMGQSRVYTLRKHGRPMPMLRSLTMAIIELLSPVLLFSKRKRAKGMAFLKGIWSVR